ncbi:exonuclease family protein [Lelliottia wanjuensis]|uniref:exodeoxyribonuclease VIII n=1 Tax=Lelliottia wanjuensis TaxID=3050585 RepID=UPI00254E7004|nr:exodeoxyribonuclease VIII [Lelliottia sp. V106_16]MDK9356761.1 exodeoxyribonuclease VIII [Lelliottia sp. V106_16]
MSVELKVFGGAYFPKDKALKKNPELKPLAIAVRSINKAAAEAVIFGKLATEHPEWIEDYFKAKVWEDREGLPCPEFDVFSSDFFEVIAAWSAETGEPVSFPAEPENTAGDEIDSTLVIKSVARLDLRSRTACLVCFGVVEEITAEQYGKIVDLIDNDNGSIQYQLARAFNEEPRVLDLTVEQLEDLQAWIRQTFDTGAQSPEIKEGVTGWINDLESATGSDNEDAGPDEQTRLRYNIARGRIARSMDFDINSTPLGIEQRANGMLCNKNDTEITNWFLPLSRTPGVYDFHPAAIISMVKTCDDHLHIYPGELRKYIDAFIASNDCINPDQLLIDIACGRSSLPVPHQDAQNEKTQQVHNDKDEMPAVCPARAAELSKELDEAFDQAGKQLAAGRGEFVPGISDPSDPKWVDGSAQPKIENIGGGVYSVDALMGEQPSNPPQKEELSTVTEDREHFRDNEVIADREIEIAHALNDLISGRTGIMGKEEAEGVVICTGHSIADVLPALITDIVVTELCLSPNFSDDEIHNVATDILDAWSDDLNVRQKVALDGIVEYRKPASRKCAAPDEQCKKEDLSPCKSVQIPESVNRLTTTLTYQQQLTLAALQGLCANPAYSAISDELPEMAFRMARAIITEEAAQ